MAREHREDLILEDWVICPNCGSDDVDVNRYWTGEGSLDCNDCEVWTSL